MHTRTEIEREIEGKTRARIRSALAGEVGGATAMVLLGLGVLAGVEGGAGTPVVKGLAVGVLSRVRRRRCCGGARGSLAERWCVLGCKVEVTEEIGEEGNWWRSAIALAVACTSSCEFEYGSNHMLTSVIPISPLCKAKN